MMAQLHCALRRASALVAVAWLSACSAPATRDSHDATATLDATVEDIGAPDVTRVRDADRARDAAVVDADAAVDGGLLALIPVDPVGGPPPGSECTSDASVRAGDPSIAPPRPILPQSVSRVTSQRPSFHWALPPGTTGARVEVCADRCCTRVITTLDAEGTTVRPGEALPPGVLFWRMFGRSVGVVGSRASYTWEFEVRRRDTPVDSSWGTIRDFTGDGYDDLLVFSGTVLEESPTTLFLVDGGPGRPGQPRAVASVPYPYSPWTGVGDFNGDGMADAVYRTYRASERRFVVVEGAREGLRLARSIDAQPDPRAFFDPPEVTDWNGDGYSDLLTSAYLRDGLDVQESALVVFFGSPSGLSVNPQSVEHYHSSIPRAWVHVDAVGDIDGDGFGDVYAEAQFLGLIGRGRYLLHGSAHTSQRVEVVPAPRAELGVGVGDGYSIASPLGDVDGDGRSDFVLRPGSMERLFVYWGSSWSRGSGVELREPPDAGGQVRGSGFGLDVLAADVNGDGLADLLVSAAGTYVETLPDLDFPYNVGRMYVYFGRLSGIDERPVWFDRTRPTEMHDYPVGFAAEISAPGDLDGNGVDDAAIVDLSRHQVCYLLGTVDIAGGRLGGCPVYPGISTSVL